MEKHSGHTNEKWQHLPVNKHPEEQYPLPDGYFDRFSGQVQQTIQQRKAPHIRPVAWFRGYPAMAIAAVLVGFIACLWLLAPQEPSTITSGPEGGTVAPGSDITQLVAQVDENILINELTNAKLTDEYLAASIADTEEKTKPSLANVSDAALELYLLEYATLEEL